MFFLERQSKPIDDGAEDLKELRNAIESLSLIHELEKDVVD